MSKEGTIAMRDALKGGKNIPLKVYADNDFVIVDESNAYAFTKWDDVNGVLFYLRLPGPEMSRLPNNNLRSVSVCAVSYEFIQAMETVIPIDMLDDVFTTLPEMDEEFKKRIKRVFDEATAPEKVHMVPATIRAAHDANLGSDTDDYYRGHYGEPFKETAHLRVRNEYVKKLNN